MIFAARACQPEAGRLTAALRRQTSRFASSPQSSEVWGIRPKLQSSTGFAAAAAVLHELVGPAAGGELPLPSATAAAVVSCVESVLSTFEAEQPAGTVAGADDIFPVLVFVLGHAGVAEYLGLAVSIATVIVPLTGQTGYYLTMFQAALEFLAFQLDGPTTGQLDEVAPLLAASEEQLPALEGETLRGRAEVLSAAATGRLLCVLKVEELSFHRFVADGYEAGPGQGWVAGHEQAAVVQLGFDTEVVVVGGTVQLAPPTTTGGGGGGGTATVLTFGSSNIAERWASALEAAAAAAEPTQPGLELARKKKKRLSSRFKKQSSADALGPSGSPRPSKSERESTKTADDDAAVRHRLRRLVAWCDVELPAEADIFEYAADRLVVKFQGTAVVWPRGSSTDMTGATDSTAKKAAKQVGKGVKRRPHTEYCISVSLRHSSAAWAVKSRWSHFEALEAAVGKELKGQGQADLPRLRSGDDGAVGGGLKHVR